MGSSSCHLYRPGTGAEKEIPSLAAYDVVGIAIPAARMARDCFHVSRLAPIALRYRHRQRAVGVPIEGRYPMTDHSDFMSTEQVRLWLGLRKDKNAGTLEQRRDTELSHRASAPYSVGGRS